VSRKEVERGAWWWVTVKPFCIGEGRQGGVQPEQRVVPDIG
jgi:hypothetical protein